MGVAGRSVAALAGGAQLASAFLAWTATGTVGLDVTGPGEVRVALSLVVLAAAPLLALLVGDRGWPRVVSGTLTAALVLLHLGQGPDGVATDGVLVAVGASIGHWLAAALATGPVAVARLAPRT